MLDETTTGRALERLRQLSGMSERAAARSLGVKPSILRSWECHRTSPDADQIARAVTVYGRDLGDAIAPRTPLTDPTRPGVLIVGEEEVVVADHLVPGSSTHEDNGDLLSAYLAAVRRQRGLADIDRVDLRSEDLAALAVELDLGDAHLQQLLADMLDLTPAGAQFTVRTLLVGALVALIASGVVQGSWMSPTASASESRVPAVRTEQIDQHRPTFWAGDLGPTTRGPVFASPLSTATGISDTLSTTRATTGDTTTGDTTTADATIVLGPPFTPGPQLTTDTTPYAIFSVDPPVEIGTAVTLERDQDEQSDVFSVTPRDGSGATGTSGSVGSATTVPTAPALPAGSPALPPGD